MSDTDPRPPVDDLDFNDPAGWGFCDYCAFAVAVIDGLRAEHRRYRNGYDDARCAGSGGEPILPIPREARPRQVVSFRKETERARRKAYWQRQRFAARATARRKVASMTMTAQPNKVTVTSMATGEEIDITDAIIGPVHLDMEEDDGEERDRS